MFGAVKLDEDADTDKYSYSEYGIEFDFSLFLISNFERGKDVINFGVDNSSSVHIDNQKKDILVHGKSPTQGLDDTTITLEAKSSISFSRSQKEICLSLHYNGSNIFSFVTVAKIYHFKAKDYKIKPYSLCLGNTSKDFTANNMKKKTGLNKYI